MVPYNYLEEEFKNTKNIFYEWKKLIKSTDYTLGRYIKKIENKICSYLGINYCIAVNNGTDGLILGLKSLDIKKNDEVILPTNTFYATAGSVVAVGAKPIFADVTEDYQIDVNDVLKKINKNTKVIIPVYWGGGSPKIDILKKKIKKLNQKIYIIEDACMGLGGEYKNKRPGTFGDIGVFSFHPLKTVNAIGDGGALVTNNYKIYKWCLKYRNHGMINRDKIDFWGVNLRMQPLQSVVILEGLKKLDENIKKRNKNAKLLDSLLTNLEPFVKLPKRSKHELNTFCLYMVLVKKRKRLIDYLKKKGVEVKIHYPIPLHLQKAAKTKNKVLNLPNAEFQAKNLLTLPIHQYLTNKEIIYMANCIKNFYFKDA